MKKILLSCFGIFFFVFSFLAAEAQNYQPFRKGPTYHYIAQDSIYSLRVDSVKVVGGDSVFVFNQTYRKVQPISQPGCSQPHFNPRFLVTGNNQFGQSMIKASNGDYKFRSFQGQEFLLKTKVPIGSTWTANANSGITVTLLVKTFEPVLQTHTDSVITFLLSNGKTIKLSKNYGFTKTPNLVSYLTPDFSLKELNFYSLPEKGLGNSISSPFAIYDFQVGDEFRTRNTFQKYGSPIPCTITWTKKKILTRNSNLNSDTVTYQIETQNLYKAFGKPLDIFGCTIPATTILSPVTVETLIVTKNYLPVLNTLSQSYFIEPSTTPGQAILNSKINLAITNSIYNQRKKVVFFDTYYRSCSNTLEERLDIDITTSYAVGLGKIGRVSVQPDGYYSEILECYTKGSEAYGNCLTFAQIMATKEDLGKKPLVQAFPNPFTSELTLTFGETSGKTQLSLRNSLGQLVWQQEMAATQNAEVKVKLPELAKGLYVLQATQNGKVFTSRLVKE